MRKICMLLAVIFTFSLCYTVVPEDSFAKSEKKDLTASATKKADKVKKAAKQKTAKSTKKVTKDIPKNVNINNADKKLLTQLPGIGPVTADAILKYRKSNGKFKNLKDLTKVKGIGDKTLLKLKPYLKKL